MTALRNAMGGGGLFDITDGRSLGRCHLEVVEALLEAEPALQLLDTSWLQAVRRLEGGECEQAIALLDATPAIRGSDATPTPAPAGSRAGPIPTR